MTEAQPAKKAKRAYQQHGLTALTRTRSAPTLRELDGRSSLALELKAERQELIAALGGSSDISPQELAIIEMIAQKRIRRKPIQEWALLNRDALFNRRKRSLAPIALQLEQLEESEVRLLKELGLKRRARQVPSLADYMANGKPAVNTADTTQGDATTANRTDAP